jgi:hypothetical protein
VKDYGEMVCLIIDEDESGQIYEISFQSQTALSKLITTPHLFCDNVNSIKFIENACNICNFSSITFINSS